MSRNEKKIDWKYEGNIHFAQFPNTFLNTQVCGVFFSPMQETVQIKNDNISHIFVLGAKYNVGYQTSIERFGQLSK